MKVTKQGIQWPHNTKNTDLIELVQERHKTNSKKNNKKQQSAITQTLGEEVICIRGSPIILSKMCKF